MSSSNSASLRPAWHKGSSGGRGFQPPPTASERRDKARSSSIGSHERPAGNKFAVLDDEEGGASKSDERASGNPRSEAFRSSFNRSSSTGSRPSGRSLADLAASVPDSGPTVRRGTPFEGRTGRFPYSRPYAEGGGPPSSLDSFKPDPSVVRYTREKLLSMRPVPKPGVDSMPQQLIELKDTVFVSKESQDPVCWDNFDGEEIWESYRERRAATGAARIEGVAGGPRLSAAESDPRRKGAPSLGRWARGVSLPTQEEQAKRKSDHAESPDELWDDPIGGATGADADFSAFGAMPPDGGEVFDFDKMAEASRKLEEEIHGSRHADNDETDPSRSIKTVDTSRPLSSAGMTITSGSGDDVNVFEDFDAPSAGQNAESGEPAAVRSANEDPSSSSRLMQMIGVEPPKEPEAQEPSASNPWGGEPSAENKDAQVAGMDPIFGSIGGLSLNPWGASAAPTPEGGIDLAGRLEALAAEQKAREQQIEMEKRAQHEADMLRRRQEEEAQRRVMAQRQAEEQARQHQHVAMQQQRQQQASQQAQVEMVLMERICSILENSWGRSDLVSILSTLHSEDSRVIPLLGSVDALRALITRSPQRIALRRDPNFAGDMAVLLVTNAQWKQQQAQVRAHEEEVRRRQMEEEARMKAPNRPPAQIDPELPWFYSDPQKNIQGPFSGEEMRQWLEAGYFKGDLPISQQSSGPFYQLALLFPDLNVAFKASPDTADPAKEEADKKAKEEALAEQRRKEEEAAAAAAEEERKAAEKARAEAEAREAAEQEKAEAARKAAEAERASAAAASKSGANGGNNKQSTQLKMLLGVSNDGGAKEAPAPSPSKPTAAEKKASKGSGKGSQPKAQQAEVKPQATPAPVEQKPAVPAWGGVANTKPTKSMSEIQREEARAAALLAVQTQGAPRQPSSGWANVAAGTQGWSTGVVKPTPISVAAPRPTQVAQPRRQNPAGGVAKPQGVTGQQRATSVTSSAEEFGATMNPALEKWCKEQMQKIAGSDDLTLVAFCMTLNDAAEIRQYLTTYLGSSSQVNNFATEFINRRGLGSKQEEWETTNVSKKGRKKKASGR
eukprot:Nitzschia sp. Nitz4//scaffold22_size323478//313194//316554//NITZ4_000596-RA/size323478-processed-gene-0.430-mRNA-1//1//CDS//3329543204//2854//frame0